MAVALLVNGGVQASVPPFCAQPYKYRTRIACLGLERGAVRASCGYFGPSGGHPIGGSNAEHAPSAHSVAPETKGSLLAPRRSADQQAQPITEIDVVGLRGATVTFRDAQGGVLFRIDRISNSTTIAKGTVLPEVTVREKQQQQVKPLQIQIQKPATLDAKLPDHCEPVFSRVAAPKLSQVPGRCVV